ncbi:MAG TPA: hypothetical protein VF557_05445 [Jatrophihabitans sp.]|uniref:hypothetical protein n=1 Tax=Jatrophihabitans sp. TaxID=1932789 RepID=UPI002F03015C
MVRKLRKSADTRVRLPEAYTYNGSSADAGPWVRALAARTGDFAHQPIDLAPPRRARRRDHSDTLDLPPDLFPSAETGGGGSGGGGDWLDGADEYGLVIIAVIVVLLVVAVAAPLGLIAIEIVLTLGLAAAGVILRLANIKPWTVLVLRNGIVVAVVAVKGWRSSRSVIAALRQHAT